MSRSKSCKKTWWIWATLMSGTASNCSTSKPHSSWSNTRSRKKSMKILLILTRLSSMSRTLSRSHTLLRGLWLSSKSTMIKREGMWCRFVLSILTTIFGRAHSRLITIKPKSIFRVSYWKIAKDSLSSKSSMAISQLLDSRLVSKDSNQRNLKLHSIQKK